MANMNTTALQAKAQAAGLDWSKLGDLIRNLNLVEVMSFIQTIISLFRSTPQPMMRSHQPGTGCGPDDVDVHKAHFEAIKALAECGAECCTGGTA